MPQSKHAPPSSNQNRTLAAATPSPLAVADAAAFIVLEPRVRTLCHTLGLGAPTSIAHLHSGQKYLVLALTFEHADYRACVLQLPRRAIAVAARSIQTSLAVLYHLTRAHHVRAPHAVAYDTTAVNALGRAFLLLTRVAGVPLSSVWSGLTPRARTGVAVQIAALLAEFDTVRFDGGGWAGGGGGGGGVLAGPLAPADAASLPLRFAWADALKPQCTVAGLPAVGYDPLLLPRLLRMVTASAPNAISVLCHVDLAPRHIMVVDTTAAAPPSFSSSSYPRFDDGYDDGKNNDDDDEDEGYDNSVDAAAHGLCVTRMVHAAIDGTPANIEITSFAAALPQWRVTGVVGWDGACALPPLLARHPPTWLWGAGLDEDVAREPLPELREIKDAFDSEVERRIPGYGLLAYGTTGCWARGVVLSALEAVATEEQDAVVRRRKNERREGMDDGEAEAMGDVEKSFWGRVRKRFGCGAE